MNHFTLQEFACRCGKCGSTGEEMSPNFLEVLERARGLAGVPFKITSGYRCPAHNRAVGGVAGSAHAKGQAVDIACINSRDRAEILLGLISQGVTRIGIAKDFIHADVDPDKPESAVWVY